MARRELTRRQFLGSAGAGLFGASLLGAAGCEMSGRPPGDPPDTGSAPNVVLVIIDSLRKDHVGAYGTGLARTPNLDALAKESLRFTRAYPESLPTICARRAIHTGMRAWPFRDWQQYAGVNVALYGWQPIPTGQTTLAEILNNNGYLTMMATDNLHQYKARMNFHRGFEAFDFFRGQTTDGYRPDWTYPPEKVEETMGTQDYFRQYFANVAGRKTEEDFFAPLVFNRASEFLEAAGGADAPFFLTVDCYDPHAPYDPPEEYVRLYDDEPYSGDEPLTPHYGPSDYYTERQLARLRARYAGEVTMVDRWLGRFLDRMEELGLSDNTLLVVLSDHGIAHGEHGLIGKPPFLLYPEVTDLPFMIRHPEGAGAGRTSDFFASTHDVAPTILGYLGIEPPAPLEGQDLSVVLEGEEPGERAHFVAGYHDQVFARDDRYAMFGPGDGTSARLFDLQDDPKMRKNVAGKNPDVVKRMFEGYVLRDAGGPLPSYNVSGSASGG